MDKGDAIRVRKIGTDDEWCAATVILVSPNGNSVALELCGFVHAAGGGIIGGVLPLLIDYEAETVNGLDGCEYEVEVCAAE